MPTIASLLLIIILIPAALAGISTGTSELLSSVSELRTAVDQFVLGVAPVLPHLASVLYLVGGVALLALAIVLGLRGLQSRP